ncbi:molybdenum ABC transporter ATP-binding protein [Lacibacterium aquatile]|uniref:Molybdenum ABC transporter ATP-binding protein n=1 Tax=Lacibacterium aquatile TaxID=1168082 RepID=A0ABW5DVH0_9PROT
MSLVVDVRQKLGDFSLAASFTAASGVTVLFGRSGSGKTSLMRLLAGLARPDDGRILLGQEALVDTTRATFVPPHRRRFGYVFQEARLFPHLSVRRNLLYGRWFNRANGEDFDRIVDLLGIEPLLERGPGKLSGGEQQRVAIGRALLAAPRLLLMDEPLAALDEARRLEILPYLERLRDTLDIPIVYVSHSVAEVARLANRVVLLKDGRVEATGSAQEILSQPKLADRRDTGALIDAHVERIDDAHHLSLIRLRGGLLYVPGTGVTVGRPVRVHLPARDVMLATQPPQGLSALNILPGTVISLAPSDDGSVLVQVECGGDMILSRITTLSATRLDLTPGKPVFAIVKTVALEPA